jgi:hypothetical protein
MKEHEVLELVKELGEVRRFVGQEEQQRER